MQNLVFVSCSQKDRKWFEEVKQWLTPLLERSGLDLWDSAQSATDGTAKDRIMEAIRASKFGILLVSASYLSSEWISRGELPALLDAAQKRELTLFWLPLSASSYVVTPLAEVEAFCDPGKPLDTLPAHKRRAEWERLAQSILAVTEGPRAQPSPHENPRVVILYKHGVALDEKLLAFLKSQLTRDNNHIFLDQDMPAGIVWGRRIAEEIQKADAVIPILSAESVTSETLAYEVRLAVETAQSNGGRPHLFPIRVRYDGTLPRGLEALNPIHHLHWRSDSDNSRLARNLAAAIRTPTVQFPPIRMPAGGPVPPGDALYIERVTDLQLDQEIGNGQSIVLIKGARQMGRTSLLARGLLRARTGGAKIAYVDFLQFNLNQLATLDNMYRSVAEYVAEGLGIKYDPDAFWLASKSPNANLERFLKKHVLRDGEERVVWGMDEVDRLFSLPYSSEFFGFLRSLHNQRTIKPDSCWERLTILIAYATEPYLFIQDLNQSPFNVGVKLQLADFTLDQVLLLNDRCGSPLKSRAEAEKLYELLGGQPFLVRRSMYELSKQPLDRFLECASWDDGPFGDHLRRILVLLASNPDLSSAVVKVLSGKGHLDSDQFFRLVHAGVFAGDSPESAEPRCPLYREYLERHLLPRQPAALAASRS